MEYHIFNLAPILKRSIPVHRNKLISGSLKEGLPDSGVVNLTPRFEFRLLHEHIKEEGNLTNTILTEWY